MADLQPRPGLLVREVDGEIVVLDRESDRIHTLNPTASFIWNALKTNHSAEAIVQSLVETFDVDPAQAAHDVDTILKNFREMQLIESD